MDPCHKHTENVKLVVLIPDAFFFKKNLSLCFKTNLALTLTAWTASTLVGSEQEPTLSGVLYTVVCWRWQLNFDGMISVMVAGGRRECDTPLGLSQWACAPTTAASVKADCGVNPPRRGAESDSVVLIHHRPSADDRRGYEDSLHASNVCLTSHTERFAASFRITVHSDKTYPSVY